MTVIYRPLATSKFRTHNAQSVLSRLNSDNDIYYMSIGQLVAWDAAENDNNFRPPYPIDTPDIYADYWANIHGYIKVDKNSVRFVTDRKDWGDPNRANSKVYVRDDIIVTNTIEGVNTHISQRDGYMVYRRITGPTPGSPETIGTTFPIGESTLILTGDGYKWEYLYTIPRDEITKFCTKEYITVPGPDQLADLSFYGRENMTSTVFDKNRLIYELGANKLMFYTLIEDTYFTDMIVAGGDSSAFRQISLIVNPYTYTMAVDQKDLSGDPVYFNETGEGGASINNWKIIAKKADDQTYTRTEMLYQTGEMIYIENRAPIFRSFNQLEEVRIVLSY